MRTRFSSAFTLIELITVMAIIAILVSIVIGIAGHTQDDAARRRALAEITMLHSAIENYRADNGNYPQNAATDLLNPKADFSAKAIAYENASLFLYEELTGDKDADGVPDDNTPAYLKSYDPRILLADRDPASHRITRVYGFQDPWGNYYGYSTAHLAEELKYQAKLKAGASHRRPKSRLQRARPGYVVHRREKSRATAEQPGGKGSTRGEVGEGLVDCLELSGGPLFVRTLTGAASSRS
jgi:prepilin-type N-terminal cleavage/methylation domain-containing protein